MSKDKVDALVKRMEMIVQDMENDAERIDGKPFNGRTVAQYFGNQGAAIAALADTIKEMLISCTDECEDPWHSNQVGPPNTWKCPTCGERS